VSRLGPPKATEVVPVALPSKLISSIKKQYNKTSSYKKRQWSSLVTPIFTKRELEGLGWKFTNEAFATANQHAKEFEPGDAVPKRQRPDLAATPEQLEQLETFLRMFSKPHPSMTVKIPQPETQKERYQRKKRGEHKTKLVRPVSVLTCSTWSGLYDEYLANVDPNNRLSWPCFYQKIPQYYKLPKKCATDQNQIEGVTSSALTVVPEM